MLSFFTNRPVPNGTPGGVRGRRPTTAAPYSILLAAAAVYPVFDYGDLF